MEINGYLDSDGYVHRHKGVYNSENAVEFTVIAYFLGLVTRQHCEKVVLDYLDKCSKDKKDTKYKLSHDNLTACYVFLDEVNLGHFPEILLQRRKDLGSIHPREWAFYNLLEGKGNEKINRILISAVMIFSVAKKYKTSVYGSTGDKIQDRIKIEIMKLIPFINFKGFHRVEMVGTDTKILAWLRCQVFGFGEVADFLCTLVKNNDTINNEWKGIFQIYFDLHPIAQLESSKYDF